MKEFNFNLQRFDDEPTTYTLTAYKDAGVTSVTASKDSGIADKEEVTLTIVMASGYELADIEVVSGGCTVNMSTKKVKINAANGVVYVKSKSSTLYKVVETTKYSVNGVSNVLTRNMKLKVTANGSVYDVECEGTSLASVNADIIAQLVKDGALVKM